MFQPTGTGDWDNLLPQRIFYSPSVGCRHVRPVRQLGVNLPKTAGQKHKKYPRFQVEIRGISFHLFPQVAGGFAFLPYAATLCGTQRMEIRRFKKPFGYSHSVAAFLPSRHSSCAQFSVPSRAECRQVTPCRVSSAPGTKAGTTSKTHLKLRALSLSFCPKGHGGQPLEARYRRKRPF